MKWIYFFLMLVLLGVANSFAQQNGFPVTLSNPMDYDTIIETEPNFVWQTNITAIQTDPRYSQRFVLCELEANQLKGDAIAINTPILVLEDYQNTMYSYSSSSTPLEEGHTYVWQVSILFNNMIVDQSEPFQFTISEPEKPLLGFYPVVFKNDGQMLQIKDDQIRLITEETGELNLKVKLSSKNSNNEVYLNEYVNGDLLTETTSPIGNKQRLFVLNVGVLDLEAGYYSASWTAKRGKTYQFNFKVQ